ncbi:hypothetical protein [Reinekea sp. G2M2-21]|uniref:hypothetical protein n=1 Tax=Reinekea sp. G2M2-21 TaxID=2788942 RepID=UPI0018AAE012|nr:hypothetical protein [Reinekea sp. G2M2-21]
MTGYQRKMIYNKDMEALVDAGAVSTKELKEFVVTLSRFMLAGDCHIEIQTFAGLLKVLPPETLKSTITEVNKMLIDKQSELLRIPVVSASSKNHVAKEPATVAGALVSTPVRSLERSQSVERSGSSSGSIKSAEPNALGC